VQVFLIPVSDSYVSRLPVAGLLGAVRWCESFVCEYNLFTRLLIVGWLSLWAVRMVQAPTGARPGVRFWHTRHRGCNGQTTALRCWSSTRQKLVCVCMCVCVCVCVCVCGLLCRSLSRLNLLKRLQWTDNSFEMLVFDQTEIGACVCVLLCRSLLHLNLLKRLQWTDDSFEMLVFDQA
jgi:hypothetical protein